MNRSVGFFGFFRLNTSGYNSLFISWLERDLFLISPWTHSIATTQSCQSRICFIHSNRPRFRYMLGTDRFTGLVLSGICWYGSTIFIPHRSVQDSTTLQVCNYHLIFSSFILLYFCYRDLLLTNLCRNPDPRTTCSSLASNHESREAAIHEIPATKDIARVGITILPSCQSKFTDEI